MKKIRLFREDQSKSTNKQNQDLEEEEESQSVERSGDHEGHSFWVDEEFDLVHSVVLVIVRLRLRRHWMVDFVG